MKEIIEKQTIINYLELLRNQTKSKIIIECKLAKFVTYLN